MNTTLSWPSPALMASMLGESGGMGSAPKVAVTPRAAFMVTVQVLPSTLSQPVHASKDAKAPGVAVSVTMLPAA